MMVESLKHNIIPGLMFSDEQLNLIAEAVEDLGVMTDEETADKCSEILDIIDAYFINKSYRK